MNSLLRSIAAACLIIFMALLAGCTSGKSDSAAKADAEDPALRNSMPTGGDGQTRVPGMGGGPQGQGGPGMGKAGGPQGNNQQPGGQPGGGPPR